MLNTTTLPNGNKQHTIDGWIGIQGVGEPMVKTKWRRTDYTYWEVNGYTVTRDNNNRYSCECKGYIFRKKCRHIQGVSDGRV